jgi:hypothetical protein
MIVLDKLHRDAGSAHPLAAIGLGEKAARVAMNARNDEFDVRYIQGPYYQKGFLAPGACKPRSRMISQSGTARGRSQVVTRDCRDKNVTVLRRVCCVASSKLEPRRLVVHN